MPELAALDKSNMPETDPESLIYDAARCYERGDARACCDLLYAASDEQMERFVRAQGIALYEEQLVEFIARECIDEAEERKKFLQNWSSIKQA